MTASADDKGLQNCCNAYSDADIRNLDVFVLICFKVTAFFATVRLSFGFFSIGFYVTKTCDLQRFLLYIHHQIDRF